MSWLLNPWIVGVGGGVISGLLVTAITRYLFAKRERREYRQKVETANNEIIYTIRPAIAEKVIPSNAMLEALFSATARKYSVNSNDLLSRVGLANELMKEVMDNTFLSSQQKVVFCELLAALKQPETEESTKRLVEVVTITKREDALDLSTMLGATTALMAVVMTMYLYIKDKEDLLVSKEITRFIPMLVVAVAIPIVAFILIDLTKRLRRIRREANEEKTRGPNGASIADSSEGKNQMPNEPIKRDAAKTRRVP
jgi:ABC-type multidrug transport system fused ATPase/permease subunit